MKMRCRNFLSTLLFFLLSEIAFSQEGEIRIYDPTANVGEGIAAAIKKAKAENKQVLLQAGGNWCNWCNWCIEFNRFSKADPQIDSLLDRCFVVYHLNYSKENTNQAIFAKYGFPQRFGFPVFIILDQDGKLIHTQDSEYLEQGKSYNKKKVFEFLLQCTFHSFYPSLYK